jgi:hypothetical protein
MTRLRTPALVLALALALTGLAGCGGSSQPKSDLSKLSTTQLLAKAKKQIQNEKYVSVKGKISEKGTSTGIDLNYIDDDSHGVLTINGASVEIETVSGKTYFKPSNAFWKAQMGPSASQIIKLIDGRWIIADAKNASFQQLISLASRSFVTDQILDPSAKVTKGKGKKVDGVDCIALTTSDGILYLDRSTARPVQIAGATSQTKGTADFSYDKIDKPTAPSAKDSVDVSKLSGS